jgi:TRAP-type C4-dicarboxylate transport system permease small subunit
MSALNRLLDKLMFYLLAASQTALVGICVLQVISRYIFNYSFTWVEEISILILVWAVWVAACLATTKATHLRIALIDDYLGTRVNLVIRIILNCMGTIYFIAVFLASRTVLNAMSFATFSSLPTIPLNATYASATFGSLMLVYYLMRLLVEDFRRLSAPEEKKE